jgi:hypothetical protein
MHRVFQPRCLAATTFALAALLMPTTARAVVGRDLANGPVQVAVIPEDTSVRFPVDIAFAGSAGFLTRTPPVYGSSFAWTDYSSGHASSMPDVSALFSNGRCGPAGPDAVGCPFPVGPGAASGDVSEFDFTTRTWAHYAVPPQYDPEIVRGNQVVVSDSTRALWVLTFTSPTAYGAVAVTGLPSSFDGYVGNITGTGQYVLLESGAGGVALLDLATGSATLIPAPTIKGSYQGFLTPTQVGLKNYSTGQMLVFSLAGLISSTDTSYQAVSLPTSYAYIAGIVPGAVIVALADPMTGLFGQLMAYPVNGGAPATVLADVDNSYPAAAPDGSILETGSPTGSGWGVQRISGDGSGAVTATEVLGLGGPLHDAGLSFSQGLLRHIEALPLTPLTQAGVYEVYNHVLAPDDSADDRQSLAADVPYNTLPCASGAQCVHVADAGLAGTTVLVKSGGKLEVKAGFSGWTAPLPSSSGTIIDASPGSRLTQYALINGSGPSQQYLVTPGSGPSIVRHTYPVAGAGLWFSTMWRASGSGQLTEHDLQPYTKLATIETGASCAATDVQISARWVYWTCGLTGPAGLYEKASGKQLHAPAGLSLLGDGYLVQAQPATASTVNLVLYDFHAGTLAAPFTFATIPAGPSPDSRGITWAVDKYSGDIAYVDAADAVHVVNPGVPATPPTNELWRNKVFQSYWNIDFLGPPSTSVGALEPSRPITGWTVQIRFIHGPVIQQLSGSSARILASVRWNGLLPDGQKAVSGRYSWTAQATVAGSQLPASFGHGTIAIHNGTIPIHSEDGMGQPTLLVIHKAIPGLTAHEAFWYEETPGGRLMQTFGGHGFDGYWSICGHDYGKPCVDDFIPFGDVNGDGYPDLLVRYGSGVLKAFLGFGSPEFSGAKSVLISRHFERYNAIAAPGELDRDTWPDLVARDGQGRLWLYRGTGRGKLASRRLIGSGWNRYARMIGAGNLMATGTAATTGPGDLLAVTKAGAMRLFPGNGHGGFAKPVRVAGNWSGYNTVIAIGDMNHDGRNDLIARDDSGRLWLFDGNGHGGFAHRVLLARNWRRWMTIY